MIIDCVMSDDAEGFHVFAYGRPGAMRYVPARCDPHGRYMQPLPERIARGYGPGWSFGPLNSLERFASLEEALRAGRAMFAGV